MPICAVVGCSRRYRAGEEVRLFSLPKVITNQCKKSLELSSRRRAEWLSRINRNMTGKKVAGFNVRVCDRHFISGKPSALFECTHSDWAPSLHLGYERKKGTEASGSQVVCGQLQENVEVGKPQLGEGEMLSCSSVKFQQDSQSDSPCVMHRTTQTLYSVFDLKKLLEQNRLLKQRVEALKGNVGVLKQQHASLDALESFVSLLKDDPEAAKFYTGFTHSQLVAMFKFFVGEVSPSEMKHWEGKQACRPNEKVLSRMEEFIVTLVRLRSGLLVKDIAYRFEISMDIVCQTVTTWIHIMHQKFKSIAPLMFASREKVKETLPKRFQNMPNIRIIIDGAEIFCQTPSDFSQQSNTYSQYKAHSSFKFLLGCTPTGAVSFVSELFEGRICDRQLVIKSGLLDSLDEGDLVLANRTFTVKDIIDNQNIDLRLPAFMEGRDKISPQEEMESRAIAKCRMSVEHGVRSIKEFAIFQETLPQSMRHIASQMVQVCAYITNFQPPLDF